MINCLRLLIVDVIDGSANVMKLCRRYKETLSGEFRELVIRSLTLNAYGPEQ